MTTARRYVNFSQNPTSGWVIDEDLTARGTPGFFSEFVVVWLWSPATHPSFNPGKVTAKWCAPKG